MRILMCRDASGSVAFPPGLVAGHAVTCERQYSVEDHVLILNDFPEAVLSRDAGYLLSVPGGLFRMPTPAEQDAIMAAQCAAASVQEQDTSSTPSSSSQETPIAPAVDPAKSKKSTGNGGG